MSFGGSGAILHLRMAHHAMGLSPYARNAWRSRNALGVLLRQRNTTLSRTQEKPLVVAFRDRRARMPRVAEWTGERPMHRARPPLMPFGAMRLSVLESAPA